MDRIDLVFQIVSIIIATLAIGILLWKNQEDTHTKRLLVLLLVVVSILNLNCLLYHSGWYKLHPEYHKLLNPFGMLLAPLSFLYIRSILFNEFRFRKYDWMFIIPAIFIALNLTPYYLLPYDKKEKLVILYYENSKFRLQNSDGILPGFYFSLLRAVWSFLFIFLNFKIVNSFTKKARSKVIASNHAVLQWITILNYTLALLLLASIVSTVISLNSSIDFHITDIAIGSVAFIICLALFTNPKILYGLHIPIAFSEDESAFNPLSSDSFSEENIIKQPFDKTIQLAETVRISTADALDYKKIIKDHFETKKPFLQSDYVLTQLVKELKIPRYALSAFINKEYNMGFREFLNRHRIEYMLQNLNRPEWQNFTLEAIAGECGFCSRTTFIKNFKEVTGQTPSNYLKRTDI